MSSVAAIDLGATSGRVISGSVQDGVLRLQHVSRFANTPVRLPDGLYWDVLSLYSAAMSGLGRACRQDGELIGAAVDSWAVDYGLLRGERLLGNPYHYRDERHQDGVARVHAIVGPEELYRRNGLQHLAFNTVFQLAAADSCGELDEADRLLLVPDLIGYWATGQQVAERTNASTTGLLPTAGDGWDTELIRRLGLRSTLLPTLVEPGTPLGPVKQELRADFGISDHVAVTTVGSHDTASAVVAVPMDGLDTVYISCGTWSLVGAELASAVATEDARRAGFTNEGGVDGRTRFLKNVMGLWLLSESLREWERRGQPQALAALLDQAADVGGDVPVFDVNDPRLLTPGDMPGRIHALLQERGAPPPPSPAALVRSTLQSLADAYADTVRDIDRLTGRTTRAVHLVGGGAHNTLLCQLTADTVGLPVIAGPVEATAIGNLLVQARTHRLLTGDLEALRTVVARSFPLRAFHARTTATRSTQRRG